MKTSFIQFLLIFSVLSLLFFPQTSVQGAKMGWFYGLQRSHRPFTFFTAHWFYAILPNIPSDLPLFYPLKKLFLVSMRTFLHLYSRFFLWMSPRCEDHWWFYFLWIFYVNLKEKSYYIPAIRSVPCSLLDIRLHWSFMQNFCSALFLLPVFSCPVLSDLSGLFIFYKRFSTYAPLFFHHCTQKSQQIR